MSAKYMNAHVKIRVEANNKKKSILDGWGLEAKMGLRKGVFDK